MELIHRALSQHSVSIYFFQILPCGQKSGRNKDGSALLPQAKQAINRRQPC
jgi:hypothetical protein